MTDGPFEPLWRTGPLSRRAARFRADDEQSAEAKHLRPLLRDLLAWVGVGGIAALVALLGASVALLKELASTPGEPAPPLLARDPAADEDAARLVAGDADPAVLQRLTAAHGGRAAPALLDLLTGTPDPERRRRAARGLRLVAEAHDFTLLEADLERLEAVIRADADPQVRADCARARDRIRVLR